MQISISAHKYLGLRCMCEGKLWDIICEGQKYVEGVDPLSGFISCDFRPTYTLRRYDEKEGKIEIEVNRKSVYNIEYVFLIEDKNDIKEIDLS